MPPPEDGDPDTGNAPGRVLLERYRIERPLGAGGMGEVLLAHDELLHRRVALKRLRTDGKDPAARRHAILKEARRLSQMNDPCIAAIHDVLELDGDVLLVMEYVEGTTLREHMARPLSPAEFWPLALPCVEALAAAHAHGLIHRDIKPENLMVTPEGLVKILDFGLAIHAPQLGTTTPTMTQTQAPPVAGTPAYMAPEAHLGKPMDERTDLFSLGVVFYEMLTGARPFVGDTYAAVLGMALTTMPPHASERNPAVGDALSQVVAKLLSKDSGARHASAVELLGELIRAKDGGSSAPAPPRAVSKGRGRAVGLTLVAVATAALLVFAWTRWASAPLPLDRNLAILPPTTPGASDDFASFALGLTELLASRLQRHSITPGFQTVSFEDGHKAGVHSPADARKELGATMALVPMFEQSPTALRARLTLYDTVREREIAARTIETPATEPLSFFEGVEREAMTMLALVPRAEDAAQAYGVRGAGTLRFYLQGRARLRTATTLAQATKADADLETACRTEPDAAVARAGLAAAELKLHQLGAEGDWLTKAEASARDAVRLDGARAEPYRALGAVLNEQKKPAEALVAYEHVIELDPTDDRTLYFVGRTYARLGDREREKRVYLGAIAKRPHCWAPRWWLATWQYRAGRYDEALRSYEAMIQRAPQFSIGYANLGGMLVMRGDYARAIEELRHSVALRPTKEAFDNLGTAYFNTGRSAEAVDAYNQSFQFGEADYLSWFNLGEAYYWLRDRKDQAAEAYREAVRLGSGVIAARAKEGRAFDVHIPATLATVYPKLGQSDSARESLGRAIAADSTNSYVAYCAALTYWQLNEREPAIRWLKQAVAEGYPVTWLRDSPIFHEWRDVAEFRALVEREPAETQPAMAEKGGQR
jgi:tetratricopeptide (TPR) repeat protein